MYVLSQMLNCIDAWHLSGLICMAYTPMSTCMKRIHGIWPLSWSCWVKLPKAGGLGVQKYSCFAKTHYVFIYKYVA